jgi:hypothetical protein
VGLAVRSVGAAMATASAWLAMVIWATMALRGEDLPATREAIDPGAAYVNVLLWGLVLVLPLTGAVAWFLMSPVESNWRRGGLSMVGVLGGVSLAMLTTFLAWQAAGSTGLVSLAIVATVLAALLARLARRAAAQARSQ